MRLRLLTFYWLCSSIEPVSQKQKLTNCNALLHSKSEGSGQSSQRVVSATQYFYKGGFTTRGT